MTILEIILLIILADLLIAIGFVLYRLQHMPKRGSSPRPKPQEKAAAKPENIPVSTAARSTGSQAHAPSGAEAAEAARNAAGRQGENLAAAHLKTILTADDVWLRNVELTVHGRPVEFDNVILNRNGIFILEIKSYMGLLSGEAEDYEWTQTKMTAGGKAFEKMVKNPIPQVQRQIILLEDFLKANGFQLWVNGYAYLLQKNGPVVHPVLLTGFDEIDHQLHSEHTQHLGPSQIEAIADLLQPAEE